MRMGLVVEAPMSAVGAAPDIADSDAGVGAVAGSDTELADAADSDIGVADAAEEAVTVDPGLPVDAIGAAESPV